VKQGKSKEEDNSKRSKWFRVRVVVIMEGIISLYKARLLSLNNHRDPRLYKSLLSIKRTILHWQIREPQRPRPLRIIDIFTRLTRNRPSMFTQTME
jgi:hypothetical protein